MVTPGASFLSDTAGGALLARPWNPRPCNFSWRIPFAEKRAVLRCAATQQSPRLVTVLGKGGAGKTTAAVLLAKYYASTGRQTCLLLQSTEDRTGDALLGHRLSFSGKEIGGSLTAFRLESSKLFSEPLAMLKKADAQTGFSQGALEEVNAEELSVLPGMDAILAAAVLERLAKPAGGILDSSIAVPGMAEKNFDVIVYDAPSSAEALRVLGSPKRSRWYLRRFRTMADQTDVGRVALPSAARFLDAAISGGGDRPERSTDQIWQAVDDILSKAEDALNDPRRFTAFLVAQSNQKSTIDVALRLWGGALQAGAYVGGLLLVPGTSEEPGTAFSPLKVAKLPVIDAGGDIDWKKIVESFKLDGGAIVDDDQADSRLAAVRISQNDGTVALFLPGFEKTEVKLSQWRGGSELVVDVGDQRRSITIPPGMRGKVVGAKFQDNLLTVTLKKN